MGEGLTPDDLDNNIPDPSKAKQLWFQNLLYNTKEHLDYFASKEVTGLEQDVEDFKITGKTMISVDMPLDQLGMQKQAAFCHLPLYEICTKRRVLEEFYCFGDKVMECMNMSKDYLASNEKEKQCYEEVIKKYINPLRASTSESIPQAFKQQEATNKYFNDSEESRFVQEILKHVDDDDDIDMPKSQYMVPIFEERDWKERHLKCRTDPNTTAPTFVRMDTHWKALGMSRLQYKQIYLIPETINDRVNRHMVYQNKGNSIYPDIVIKEINIMHATYDRIIELKKQAANASVPSEDVIEASKMFYPTSAADRQTATINNYQPIQRMHTTDKQTLRKQQFNNSRAQQQKEKEVAAPPPPDDEITDEEVEVLPPPVSKPPPKKRIPPLIPTDIQKRLMGALDMEEEQEEPSMDSFARAGADIFSQETMHESPNENEDEIIIHRGKMPKFPSEEEPSEPLSRRRKKPLRNFR